VACPLCPAWGAAATLQMPAAHVGERRGARMRHHRTAFRTASSVQAHEHALEAAQAVATSEGPPAGRALSDISPRTANEGRRGQSRLRGALARAVRYRRGSRVHTGARGRLFCAVRGAASRAVVVGRAIARSGRGEGAKDGARGESGLAAVEARALTRVTQVSPQTSRAVSTIRRSFARCASTAMLFP
jgi:hypothetical protein